MVCFLNPGHDRKLDSGAVHAGKGLRECDLAYELGCMVQNRLEQEGIGVLLRQDDDLQAVCDEANDAEADIFVSIHFNAFNGLAAGTETCISATPASLILGHCIQSRLREALQSKDRGLKERPGLMVLRETAMPAVLVEVCFIDNTADIMRYGTKKDAAADAIAAGIADYIRQRETNVMETNVCVVSIYFKTKEE